MLSFESLVVTLLVYRRLSHHRKDETILTTDADHLTTTPYPTMSALLPCQ